VGEAGEPHLLPHPDLLQRHLLRPPPPIGPLGFRDGASGLDGALRFPCCCGFSR
jgi:hypothetical protein